LRIVIKKETVDNNLAMVDVFLKEFAYLKVDPALAQAVHHSG